MTTDGNHSTGAQAPLPDRSSHADVPQTPALGAPCSAASPANPRSNMPDNSPSLCGSADATGSSAGNPLPNRPNSPASGAPQPAASALSGFGASGSPQPAQRSRGGVGWFGWAFLILLWSYAVYRIGALWHANEAYSFGWFMPVLCLLLFWERWKLRPHRDPVRAASGTFLVLALLALALLPALLTLEVIPIGRMAAWALALTLVGITTVALYFIGGRSYSRHFLFPVLFFLISVPWPSRYEYPLIQDMSELNAAISAKVANFMGTPAIRTGVLIETGAGLVGVDEACSGIRSFQASVMVGLFLGELFRFGFLRRLLLLLGGAAIAFLCNVVRTTFLVRTCDLKGLNAVNLYHDPAGFTILAATFVALLGLAWVLGRRKRADRESASANRESGEKWNARSREGEVGSRNREATSQEIETAGATTPQPGGASPQPHEKNAPGSQSTASSAAQSAATRLAEDNQPPVTPTLWLRAALAAVLVWIVAIELTMNAWFTSPHDTPAARATWSFRAPAHLPGFERLDISPKVHKLLRYDTAERVRWRDPEGRPWEAYYMEWLPARGRYGATTASAQHLGHGSDVCLPNAGMILQTNLGVRMTEVNGIPFACKTERLLSRGRNFHYFTVQWKPAMAAPGWFPDVGESTSRASLVLHALRTRDRDDQGQRLLKVGVWDVPTDEEAIEVFRGFLKHMVEAGKNEGERAGGKRN